MKNVILLTIDTLRYDALGCYGDSQCSPFIDSIQDRSIRFTKCQSVGPYTQASFPGILTSSYFLEYDGYPKLSPKATVVSEPIKQAGFTTAGFHSNPYLSAYFGWNRGWNVFYDSMADKVDEVNPYIKGNVINQKVDSWLGTYMAKDAGKPFFLWTHYMDVHEPYTPDPKYLHQIDSSLSFSSAEYMKLFKEVILPRDASDPATVELLKKLYMAHVIEVDEYARDFFGILQKHGVLEDSIVIITSDHGDEFSEHGALSHDGKMYSELTHVPLIVFDPSLKEGRVCDDIVSGVDVPPTILNLFGIEKPPSYRGQFFLTTSDDVRADCYGECIGKLQHKMLPTDKPAYYFMDAQYKVIHRDDKDVWEIYDLENDPKESRNLVDNLPQAEELKAKLSVIATRDKA
ncbi:MAG: sulfatase-like hydrolase/transferase [Deltaproteobacteria bacterium]|nr:sulfatase-like hydrolase/transferase [Deltaproteobacteria bacterium]